MAPCLLGGFTIAWTEESGARAVRLNPAPAVHPTLFVPDGRGLTVEARAALPATVPHADAARNAGRAALLVHALTAEPGLLLAATEDRLHQGYRAPRHAGDRGPGRRVARGRSGRSGQWGRTDRPGPDRSAARFRAGFPDRGAGAAGIRWASVRLELSNDGARIEPEARLDTPSEAGVAAGRKS